MIKEFSTASKIWRQGVLDSKDAGAAEELLSSTGPVGRRRRPNPSIFGEVSLPPSDPSTGFSSADRQDDSQMKVRTSLFFSWQNSL